MAKRGPKGPRTSVDWQQFEKLCQLHCTQVECAEFFKMSAETLEKHIKREYKENFSAVFKKKSSLGKISLRRKMFEMAMAGNSTMCIWLSKQVLGFTDKLEQKNEISGSSDPVQLVILPDNGLTVLPSAIGKKN